MFALAASCLLLGPWLRASSTRADAGVAPTPSEQARRAQVIVKGKGVEITVGDVEDALAQQTPNLRARYKDPEQLKTLVSSLTRGELLAAEAGRRGYDQNAAVRHTVKDSAAQALVRQEVEEKVTPQSIPMEDVKSYYETNATEFHRVGMRRASYIVFASADEARALLPQAKTADARGFAELAKQHSKDPDTKPHGGDLGYFAREPQADGNEAKVHLALRKAAFELKEVGDTSPAPIKLENEYAILRVTGERPERHVSLNDAAASIRSKLWRERRQRALEQLVSSLRAKDKPQVFPERLQQINFDDMEKRPGGFAPDPVAKPGDARTPAP